MSHDDFDFEPQRGIPAPLPEGERLLWQGSPNWRLLAIHAYHVRKVAIYFLVLIAWRIGNGIAYAHPARSILSSCLVLLLMGVVSIAILSALAYGSSRAAVFSITSRRVLLRHGLAVPMTLNIPFKVIESADLRVLPHQQGDVVLRLFPEHRVGYLITWPYLRAGHFTRPQPSLRALDQAPQAAAILGAALQAYAFGDATNVAWLDHMAPVAARSARVAILQPRVASAT